MKVEYSEQGEKKSPKKRKHSKKKAKIRAIFMLVAAVLVILTALSFTVFFGIEKIYVSGSSVYSQEEIIVAASVQNGDNLLLLSANEIEEHIEKVLPYIKKAEISKRFPSTVGINITPCTEKYLILNEHGSYVTDDSYKVLRRGEVTQQELVCIKGMATEELSLGQKAVFTDTEQKDVLAELMKLCAGKSIDIKYINMSSLVDIGFLINDKTYIKLGNYLDMNYKLEHLSTMLGDLDENASCSISLSSWSVDNKSAVLKYEDVSKYME